MNLSLVYFDLETGGLSPEKHPIIQLAAVATDAAGEVAAEFEAKIAFDASTADPKALAMNHYSPEAWVGAEPECIVLKQFSAWLKPHSTLEKVSKQGMFWRLLARCWC